MLVTLPLGLLVTWANASPPPHVGAPDIRPLIRDAPLLHAMRNGVLPCWGRVCSVRGHGSHIKPSLVTALCSALHCGSMAVRGVECEGGAAAVAPGRSRHTSETQRRQGEDALAEAVLTIMRCMWRWAMVGRVRHVPAGEPAPAL